jgi:amino acid adenylation domain-containing protein
MVTNEKLQQRKEHLSKLRATLSKSGRGTLDQRLRAARESKSPIEIIPRRTHDGPVRLSFPQQGMWIIEQLQSEAAYHVPTAIRLKGNLDRQALQSSFDEIIRRHESLRTSFVQIDGEPFQMIAEIENLDLPIDDLTALPEQSREPEARQIVKNEFHRSFDLTAAPLFRARLIKLGADDHVLTLVIHHIVSDLWSLGVLVRELSALYNGHSKGDAVRLPDLPIQYPDFALWQREHLQGEVLAQHLDYWKTQLKAAPAMLELPTDHPRPARQSFHGGLEVFTIPNWISERLRQLSLQEGTTLFMTLLAAFNVLLSRYSSQQDIVVGCGIAGRNRAELEGLIGFFVNTLAIRTDLSGNPTFSELLGRVKENCLGAYAHQGLPFERLVEELQPERSSRYSPIFQVMFSLQNRNQQRDQPGGNWNGVSLSGFVGKAETSKFDLSFRIIDTEPALTATMEYSRDLFNPETIKRMAGHFNALLASIVTRSEESIFSLPIISSAEQQLLRDSNATLQEYPQERCMHRLFEQQAERAPDAVALVCEGEQISYGELNARANQLARHLQTLGVGPDTLVGICVERSIAMVVGILGILKAGGAYLPLDPEYPPERLSFMLKDAAVAVLLTQERLLASLPEHAAQTLCLDADWLRVSQHSTDNIPPEQLKLTPENLAYVIYTSGSTGVPKGVLVTHANIGRLFAATEARFGFNESDTWTLFHSYAFDFSVWEFWGALIYGGKLIVVPYWVSRSPAKFYELLCAEGVTVLNQTPSAFRQLSRVEDEAAGSMPLAEQLRLVIFGGEALEGEALRDWFARHGDDGPEMVNMYGITETTVHVTQRRMSAADVGADYGSPIGTGLSDLRLYVLDAGMQVVPMGVAGELYVGGAGLARGYLNRSELTAERFVPDPYGRESRTRLYRTGDRVRHLSDGQLEFLGRVDFQVKVRGFRIELGEVEVALSQHPAIKHAAVIARQDSPGDQRLVAYLIPTDSDLDIAAVRLFLTTRLPDYMIPAAFVTLDSFPLSPSGKLDRKALPAPDSRRLTITADFVAPRSSLEQDLADIWCRLLRVERVGICDNFFELGGHSLLLTQLSTRIRDKFGVDVPMRILFDSPTIEGISVSLAAQLMDQSDDADLMALLAEMGEPAEEETIAR